MRLTRRVAVVKHPRFQRTHLAVFDVLLNALRKARHGDFTRAKGDLAAFV
jgi:hypothetical protein